MPRKKSPTNGQGPVEGHSLERVPGQEFAAEPVVEAIAPQRTIPYAPVPMLFRISQSQGSQEILVSLSIQTAEGDKNFFLDPSTGKQLGEALIAISEASANGIIYTDQEKL
jgi:hypothetical protein